MELIVLPSVPPPGRVYIKKNLYAIFIGKDSLVQEVPKSTPKFDDLVGDSQDSAYSCLHGCV